VIEVGVPAAMMIENREMPSAVNIRPEVLIGHSLDSWHWFALMIIARRWGLLVCVLLNSTREAQAAFQLAASIRSQTIMPGSELKGRHAAPFLLFDSALALR